MPLAYHSITTWKTIVSRTIKSSKNLFRNSSLKVLRLAIVSLFLLMVSNLSQANTVVEVKTSLGNFSIELFDDQTPGTVSNFLNYVNSDRYDGTVIHRSVPGFVIQGGWLTFNEAATTFNAIQLDATITNEPLLSNVRGTLAMAKQAGNPDSASSQWFVNLDDNSFLDNDNGGFTVFGRVVGNGMTVVDAISNLPRATLTSNSPFPVIGFEGQNLASENLVELSMSVLGEAIEEPVVFDGATGEMQAVVDLGGSFISLSFKLLSGTDGVVIQALAASVRDLSADQALGNIATFSGSDGRLRIPELRVNGVVEFRNVVFLLSSATELLFSLESSE